MALTLTIENFKTLPDGGPVTFTVTGASGFDVGRDTYLDWTLPDPTRYISGKHCEVRYQNGDYVLYDVSTNGTFLNGNDRRMHGPHVLRNGDRILIGNYIIVAAVGGQGNAPPPPSAPPALAGGDLWEATGAAPPASRSEIVPRASARPVEPDFLEWAMDLPAVRPGPAPPPQAPSPQAPPPAEPPRRSVWVDSSPTGAWALGDREARPGRAPASDGEAMRQEAPPPAAQPLAFHEPDRRGAAAEPRPPEPAPAASGPPRSGTDVQEALALISRGAGLPADAFARREAAELLGEIGASLRVVSEHLMQLLSARSSAKRSMRSSDHTTIGAFDNNPFKFSPTAEDALRLTFGSATRSYLHGRTAFKQGFEDIAGHQLRIFSAMQQAMKMLLEDLDPASIEAGAREDKTMSSLLSSRKARLWDTYCTTWRAKTQRTEEGMAGLFMIYFAECYDRLAQNGRDDSRR